MTTHPPRASLSRVLAAALLLALAVPVGASAAGSAQKSKKLTPGGGEPGKTYLAYFAALEKGDVARLKALKIADIDGWADDEIKVWIERKRGDEVKKVRISGGTILGDIATLDVTGEEMGKPVWGKVDMKKTDGVWRKTDGRWSFEGPVK